MDGQGIRIQRFHFFQRMRHFFLVLARQTDDQIHVDVVKSKGTRHAELLLDLLHCVVSSYYIKCLLLHGLWIDRNTGDREFADGF